MSVYGCLAVLLVVSAMLAGCAPKGDHAEPGEHFTLAPGESMRVGDHVRITFEGVGDDSRCPEGAECVWEGNAVVRLEYIAPDSPPIGFRLNTARTLTRDTTIQRHRIELVSLTPYPKTETGVRPSDYRAELVMQ